MNVRDIQIALYWKCRSSCAITIPNYTPDRWFECDVFAVTKSGYAREFEIKMTVSDFRADAKKRHRSRWDWEAREVKAGRKKHDMLDQHAPEGPTQFWYVTPPALLTLNAIPAWAGLIEAHKHPRFGRVHLREVKAAPRVHSEKVPEKIMAHARSVFYYRYWDELIRGVEARNRG